MRTGKIGGYFEIELAKRREYHRNAIRLNSGRSCLDYVLKLHKFNKIYIPFYSCNSILEVIAKNNLKHEFYFIDNSLLPVFDKNISKDEVFLYINFFGLNNTNVSGLRIKFKNIIVDNSQAFFEKPLEDVYTFYSPRKFFGVSDGGYLYSMDVLDQKFEKDYSAKRCLYMLYRSDGKIDNGYSEYKKNEKLFSNYGIREMSNLTQNILKSIEYSEVKERRNKNFKRLHNALKYKNNLKINQAIVDGAMIYPFLVNDGKKIKNILRECDIFCATYWSEVLDRVTFDKIEYQLANNMVPLPIDQRYDEEDMNKIINIIKKYE